MTKIRTIKEAVKELRAKDPDSAITEYFLRQKCAEGANFCLQAGGKYLINMDLLERFLSNEH